MDVALYTVVNQDRFKIIIHKPLKRYFFCFCVCFEGWWVTWLLFEPAGMLFFPYQSKKAPSRNLVKDAIALMEENRAP